MSVTIDRTAPWADWAEAQVIHAPLHELRVDPTAHGLTLSRGLEPIGSPTVHSLRELSSRVGFPVDFITKLPPELRCEVINDRILAARPQEFAVAVEGDVVTSVMPGWRDFNPHAVVAQVAYDRLTELTYQRAQAKPVRRLKQTTPPPAEVPNVATTVATVGSDGMKLRLTTDVAERVTRAKGDVLQLGIEVRHRYGMGLSVGLFTTRLICLNGMTADNQEMSWEARQGVDRDGQLQWLRDGLGQAVESFGDLVARAEAMANANFTGDYVHVLRERARMMSIPRRYWPAIIAAFEEEPGDTEWHLLNAITRFATHTAHADLSRRLQAGAGSWVSEFDEVTARLPRPVAHAIGAHVIEEEA